MKAFAILLCMYMVSLASSLPIISKALDDNPDHLVWETYLNNDPPRSDSDKTRKIPKSIFITPNLNESKGNCPPDHKLGPDGRCYKTLQIDPLLMLKKQIESLLKNNRTATTEYEDDYDYSEYGESTESMNSNGQYTVPLSLGFGSDNRIPQQTTFPNLNRVVKDDSHVSPVVPPSTTTTVATTSSSSISTDNREVNQPFRASTTDGTGLDSEGVFVEPKFKSTVSVTTTSSAAPSSTTAYIVESTSSQSSSTNKNPSQTFGQQSNPSEPTMATITFESLIDESTSTTTQSVSTAHTVSSTQISDATTENSSPSAKSISIEDDSTPIAEEITTQSSMDAIVSEVFEEYNTEAAVSPLTPTIENVEAPEMASSTEGQDSSQAELSGQSSNVEAVSTEATSTKTSVEHVETPNSILPDSVVANETQVKINQDNVEPVEKEKNQAEIIVEEFENKPSTIEPSVKSMNLKLESQSIATEQPEIKSVTESNTSTASVETQETTEPSTTAANAEHLAEKSDSYEVVDAYFIPSELPEEIDPAVGKNLNGNVGEPRYRLENATVISDDELPEHEAELAPVIDTGIDGRSNIDERANIELITESDESAAAVQFENEKKNLTARLAEELLFQGPNIEFKDRDNVPTKPVQEFKEPILKSESAEASDRNVNLEESLSGGPIGPIEAVPIGGGVNVGSDLTTEEPVDYDSKEIKIPTESISPEFQHNVDYDGVLPVREAVPFNRAAVPFNQQQQQQHFFQPPSPPPPQLPAVQQPSIYSTFISRLKVAPPFVELHHDRHPETVQYSHTPFDIASSFQNTSPDRRFGPSGAGSSETTHPTFTLPGDRSFEVEHPAPVRAKSLQLGINCYVKNLDKQQYIICDDA